MTTEGTTEDRERADFLEALASHRGFLLRTVRDLTDEQARTRTTVSALCLGGLIKHLSRVERNWADFIVRGPQALSSGGEDAGAEHEASFCMGEDETLAGLLSRYEEVARATEQLVISLPSLDRSQPLPPAPWFAPGARWSARRVLLHLIGETAQHAGHADIIRESLDGAKTMG
ncbi:MAG: DinB family protein [Acidimicrobiales bacterium]|jgi:uncharacterized damage-inducible protein DinB